MHKNGSINLYLGLFFLAVAILIVVAVLAPAGVMMNTEFVKATTQIKASFLPDMNNIADATIKQEVLSSLDSGVSNGENLIEVNSFLYKFGGFFIIGIPLLALFIFSRLNTEKDIGRIE